MMCSPEVAGTLYGELTSYASRRSIAPMRVKLLTQASAKSHRPERLFSRDSCPIIGAGRLETWVAGRESYVSPPYRNTDHGTFVAGHGLVGFPPHTQHVFIYSCAVGGDRMSIDLPTRP